MGSGYAQYRRTNAAINAMTGQGGCQREAAQKQENDRIGEIRKRLSDRHHMRQHRKQWNQQCGEAQMNGFRQPQDARHQKDGKSGAKGLFQWGKAIQGYGRDERNADR